MPSIFKHFSSNAKSYVFPEVTSQEDDLDEQESARDSEDVYENTDQDTDSSDKNTLIDYAEIQANAIVEEARQKAEDILEQARESARLEAELIQQEARDIGRQEGYAEGVAQALEAGTQKQKEQADQLASEVQQFLERASAALDRQMDENLNDMRDLAISIAEKVVCVSLKSSTEVIGRMVQTALEKRKRREWVHIYIAECDIKRMGQIPASLMSAISALADRVRIIPMVDDESGTCVIEMPDEIVDASVSTQMGNIRNLLNDVRQDENDMINISF